MATRGKKHLREENDVSILDALSAEPTSLKPDLTYNIATGSLVVLNVLAVGVDLVRQDRTD